MPKNWCFWTVVLEKTLASPLDCKEIQPVHSKGDQSSCSLEGLMLKLKLQYFGQLTGRVDSLEKTLMLGGIGGRRRRRWLPGASTGDPTHDKVMWRRPDKQGFRTRGTPWADPTHDKVMWRNLTSKPDQNSRDPLDLLEHLPPNQNLSVLLFYAFHQLFWH